MNWKALSIFALFIFSCLHLIACAVQPNSCMVNGSRDVTIKELVATPKSSENIAYAYVNLILEKAKSEKEFKFAIEQLRSRMTDNTNVILYQKIADLMEFNKSMLNVKPSGSLPGLDAIKTKPQLIIILYWNNDVIGLITNADIKNAMNGSFVSSPRFTMIDWNRNLMQADYNGEDWAEQFGKIQKNLQHEVRSRKSVPPWVGNTSRDASDLIRCSIRFSDRVSTFIRVNPGLEEELGTDAYGGIPLRQMLQEFLDSDKR